MITNEEQAQIDTEIRILKREIKKNYLEIAYRVYLVFKNQGWKYAYSSPEEWAHQEHGFSRRTAYNLRKLGEKYPLLIKIDSSILQDIDNIDPHKLIFVAHKIDTLKSEEEIKQIIHDAKSSTYRDLQKKYSSSHYLDFIITAEIESISRPGKSIKLKNVNFNFEASPESIFLACKGKTFKIKFQEIK